MKTTFDLPQDLVREIKIHAVKEGRKLKDTVTELLRKGLNSRPAKKSAGRVKLPLIHCKHAAVMTPEQVADVLLNQEVEWHHEAA